MADLAGIWRTGASHIPRPYPVSTPEAEQSVEVWLAYHLECQEARLRAVARAAWDEGALAEANRCHPLTNPYPYNDPEKSTN